MYSLLSTWIRRFGPDVSIFRYEWGDVLNLKDSNSDVRFGSIVKLLFLVISDMYILFTSLLSHVLYYLSNKRSGVFWEMQNLFLKIFIPGILVEEGTSKWT